MKAEGSDSRGSPQMSVVLVTDRYETIRPVIDRLTAQTAREKLEVVLVGPEDQLRPEASMDGFAGIQVVDPGPHAALGEARAAGVRAASAPLVFIGETHSYPDPGMAEELIRAHAGPWAAVVPSFANANPDGAASWAGFLADYGAWVPGVPAGEIRFAPIYNAAYRRSVLLEFGDVLGSALRGGDEMANGLRARNHRVYFAPAARIEHVNVSGPPWEWIDERYLAGHIAAAARAREWSWGRRLLYLCASPLLPLLYLSRVRTGIRVQRRNGRLPSATWALLPAGALIKAAGEMIAYARGPRPAADARMRDYEIHKSAYTASGAR